MKKRLINYLKQTDNLIQTHASITEDMLSYHRLQISLFQHERLIHLLVTIFVGLLAILFLLFALMLENISLLLAFLCLLLLFIPYILHYYRLENGVQKLYQQYDQLQNKKKK